MISWKMVCAVVLAGCLAAAATPPKLAVLEFASKDANKDRAAGLGDLLEISLQKQNVELVTRRFIALVLNERRAERSGLVGAPDHFCEKLPGVDFLIRGTIASAGSRFSLDVSVLDSCRGTEQQTFAESGSYPADIVPALDRVAAKIAQSTGRGTTPAAMPADLPGFTKSPETAVVFYRGLEHLLAGRPERAVPEFFAALRADPAFDIARRWSARAYEALGCDELAAVDYAALKTDDAVLRQVERDLSTPVTTQRVVSLLFSGDPRVLTPERVEQIKEALRADGGWQVFAPDWLPQLASEADLRLSGEFASFASMDRRIWLRSDYVAAFRVDGEGTNARIAGRALDLVTGRICARADEPADNAAGLGRSLAEKLQTGIANAAEERMERIAVAAGERMERVRVAPADLLPQALARYAAGRDDRERLLDLYDRYPYDAVPYRQALARRLDTTIRAGEPDEAAWRLRSLWMNYYVPNTMMSKRPALTNYFANFLERYEGSVAAACVHASLGSDLVIYGKPAEAFQHLTKAAEFFQASHATGAIAQVYFLTAYVSAEAGLTNDALRYLAWHDYFRARYKPRDYMLGPEHFEPIFATNGAAAATNAPGVKGLTYYSHIRLGGVDYQDWGSIRAMLARRLGLSGSDTPDPVALWHQAMEAKEPRRFELAAAYVEALRKTIDADAKAVAQHLLTKAPELLDKLHTAATTATERAKVETWGRTLGAATNLTRTQRYVLLLSSGNLDTLDALIESESPPSVLGFQYAGKIAGRRNGPRAEAERCAALLTRWRTKYSTDDRIYRDIWTAQLWEKAGDLERSRQLYAEAGSEPRYRARDDLVLSARFHAARLEHLLDRSEQAMASLKELAADPTAKEVWLAELRESPDQLWAGNELGARVGVGWINSAAAKLLEEIRLGKKPAQQP